MHVETISSSSLFGFADLARERGLDPQALAQLVGAPVEALVSPDLRIPAVIPPLIAAKTAAMSGDEAFGLRLAATRRLSNWGALAMLTREQASLRDALHAIRRFASVQNEAARLVLAPANGLMEIRVGFTYVLDAAATRHGVELGVGILHRYLVELMAGAWRPLATCFRHGPPRSRAFHRQVLGDDIAFDQTFDGMLCRIEDLDRPVPGADPVLAARLEGLLAKAVESTPATLEQRVTELIILRLADGAASRDRIAKALGLSVRSLQRRLSEEGATFAGLLEDARRRLALRYVQGSARPFAEVAELLGYSSQAAFNHWYLARHGVTPTADRAAARSATRLAA